MAYKTDGSSHRNGISIEKQVTEELNKIYHNLNKDLLNLSSDYDFDKLSDVSFLKKGGTQFKSDIDIYNKNQRISGVSVKKKKYINGKPDGTFDIINTTFSKFNKEYKVFDIDLENELLTFLDQFKDEVLMNPAILDTKIRKLMFDEVEKIINAVDDGVVYLKLAKKELLKTDYFIIARTEDGKEIIGDKKDSIFLKGLYFCKEKQISSFFDFTKKYILLNERDDAKASKRIAYLDDRKNVVKTPFRVRIALNNGLHPYFGLKKTPNSKNKKSVWTIKIQVDGVSDMANRMNYFDLEV